MGDELRGMEASIERHRSMRDEQEVVIGNLESQLDNRPQRLLERVEALEAAADPCSPRRSLLSHALRGRRRDSVDWFDDADLKEQLRLIYISMRACQEEEIRSVKDVFESKASSIVNEIHAEQAKKADYRERANYYEEEQIQASRQETTELQEVARDVWRIHEAGQAEELAIKRVALQRGQAEAVEAE